MALQASPPTAPAFWMRLVPILIKSWLGGSLPEMDLVSSGMTSRLQPPSSRSLLLLSFSHTSSYSGVTTLCILGSVSFSHHWQRSALHWALSHWGFLHAEVACAYSWQTWAWGGHIYQLSPEDSEKKIQKVGLQDTIDVRNAVPELSLSPALSLACSIWKG